MITLYTAPRHKLEGIMRELGYSMVEINRMTTRMMRFVAVKEFGDDADFDYLDGDCVEDDQ